MTQPFKRFFRTGSLTFFKGEVILDSDFRFPQMLNIEPTNDCNLACVMCARRLAERPVSYLSLDIFADIMDEARRHGGLKWLALHKDGESLLHPDFVEMVRLAKSGGAARYVHLNTNALLLNQDLAAGLIEAGLDSLTLSMDADSPEVYARVKGGGDLATVQENARGLMATRRRLGAANPWVRAKIIDMPVTRGEIDSFTRRWTGVTDEVQVQPLHNYAGASQAAGPMADRHPCSLLWYSMAVNSDGTVSTCCLDYRCRDLLGDLKTQGLSEIYTGENMQAYRRGMLAGDYRGMSSCAACESWRTGADPRPGLAARNAPSAAQPREETNHAAR